MFNENIINIIWSVTVVIQVSGGGYSANITWKFEDLPMD